MNSSFQTTRTEHAYRDYCSWCRALEIAPADYETWAKVTQAIRSTE